MTKSSLSIKKLQNLLLSKGFICDKYFVMDDTCFYIQLFSISSSENFLLYIPSKYQIRPDSSSDVFKIKTIDLEITENIPDEYGVEKSEDSDQVELSDDEKLETKLENHYKRNITIEEISKSDRHSLKTVLRQAKRLKNCVENIKYKLAIIFKNFICSIRRDDSIDCFLVKYYPREDKKKLMVIVDLETLYEKNTMLLEDLKTVRESIYKILEKNQGIHVKIFNKMLESKTDILQIPDRAIEKKTEYSNMLNELETLLKNVISEENKVLDEIVQIEKSMNDTIHMDINKAHKKALLEKELERLFGIKNGIMKNIVSTREKLENSILNIDKIMFDNAVMFDAMTKNLELLKSFY